MRGIVHQYNDTLGFVQQHQLHELPGKRRMGIVATLSDGAFLAFDSNESPPENGVITRLIVALERVSIQDATIDTLLTLPGVEVYNLAGGYRARRFAMRPALLPHDHGVVVSDGVRWELKWVDMSGKIQRIVRLNRPRRVVTDAMREAQLALDRAEIDALPAGGFTGIRRMAALDFANPRFPDSLPPFDLVYGDRSGKVWLREGVAPTDTVHRWLMFGAEGLEGVVSVPSDFAILAVRDNMALVRREDPDGVGFLELRSVQR
jgi:hypothetical protein